MVSSEVEGGWNNICQVLTGIPTISDPAPRTHSGRCSFTNAKKA